MKERDRYTSLIWVAFGLYMAFEGYRLKLGALNSPGSGFLVFWTGIAISVLSTSLFFSTFLRGEEGAQKRVLWMGLQWSKCVKLMVLLFVYALVFKWVGFLLSTFLLLLFLFRGREAQGWRRAFFTAGITAISCYFVFGVFMETQLPRGILEEGMTQVYQYILRIQ